MQPHFHRHHRAAPWRTGERGIALVITMIALVVLLIASVAMIRAFNTSSAVAGSLAFRRDLTNQGERALAQVRTLFLSGRLAGEAAREAGLPAANYAAARLQANAKGIPLALLRDSAFTAAGMSADNDIVDDAMHVRVRYVVDRLCNAPGPFDETTCVAAAGEGDVGGTDWLRKPTPSTGPVYRVTVRVDGPRSTQAFLQTTFAY